jgi:hypothetical protein
MMNDQMRIVKIQWSFKGYHHFHIRPSVGINLQVENEDNNPSDPYAVRVVVPRIEAILVELQNHVTRHANRRHPRQQTVLDVAGRSITTDIYEQVEILVSKTIPLYLQHDYIDIPDTLCHVHHHNNIYTKGWDHHENTGRDCVI